MAKHLFDGSDPFPILDGENGFGVVRGKGSKMMVDEAIMGSEGVAPDVANQPAYVGLAIGEKKLRAAFGALLLMLGVVVARAAYVQVVQGADYQRRAEGNRSRIVAVPVERGVMYDRTGTPLVRNVPDFSVSIVPTDLPKDPDRRRESIGRLALLLDVAPTDIEDKLNEFRDYASSGVIVADNLTHDQAVKVSIEEMRTSGVSLVTGTRREYLMTDAIPALSHVLGYEGRLTQKEMESDRGFSYEPSDFIGKAGLEKSYETVLRGRSGEQRIEVDATGRQKTVISEDPGQPGKNLVLTIDADLQKTAEKALREQLKIAHKSRGTVIVLNPNNGDVLAMVSEPAYDANKFAQGISKDDYSALINDPDNPLFSRAISANVASGSVFKPVVGAAAMAEHTINENTSVLSTGGIHVGQAFFPDWKAGGHGVTNLAKGIAESVNTFFYSIGGGTDSITGLGVERIVNYAKKFGYGSPLGIDLPNEGAGFLPSKEWKQKVKGERWYIGDTYHVAIGQGDVIVTPLQVAMMTTVFANHGTLYKPRVVQAMTASDGTRVEREPEVITQQVTDKFAIDAVRRGMRQTVTAGSARSLNALPVQVAGKTGTAQWNSKKDNHAWFTSFAPYDKPQITVTVLMEEGIEGSVNASPVARQIYQWYFGGRKDAGAMPPVVKPSAAPVTPPAPAPIAPVTPPAGSTSPIAPNSAVIEPKPAGG